MCVTAGFCGHGGNYEVQHWILPRYQSNRPALWRDAYTADDEVMYPALGYLFSVLRSPSSHLSIRQVSHRTGTGLYERLPQFPRRTNIALATVF